ncbi:MAG: hypothetical protein ABI348_05150, partial [Nitrososphaera sp.]
GTRNSARLLRVLEPSSLGLNDASDQKEFLERLILSCNLLLDDCIFSVNEIKPAKPRATDFSEDLSLLAKSPAQETFKINQGRIPRHSASLRIYVYDFVDEEEVIRTITMLNKLYKIRMTNKISTSDLKKSLDMFSLAMTAIEKLSCFSHLYSSLVLAVNCDCKPEEGDRFDTKVSELTGIEKMVVKNWREFNNRLKHEDRNAEHEVRYLSGKKNIDADLPKLRKTVSKAIYYRLQNSLNLNSHTRNRSLLKLSTKKLIKKFGPMLNESELKEYEKANGTPAFDIVFYHPLDAKTIWGNPKQYFYGTILHSRIANNIYDLVSDGYEVWIRDVLNDDKTIITPDHIRYAMSLEAQNMSEDGIALVFQIINGWRVISLDPYSDEFGPIAQKFYDYFEILVDIDDIPYNDDDLEFEKRLEEREKEAQPRWKKLRSKT